MSDGREILLIDRSKPEVYKYLFFIDERLIDFWLDNKDFQLEYHRLHQCGIQDGFYLFYLAACNTYTDMEDNASTGVETGFDIGYAHKTIESMERRLKNGYDDRVSDPRLNFLINRLSAPEMSIRYWLMVPEFVSALREILPKDVRITNRIVYPIMRSIYKTKSEQRSGLLPGDRSDPFNMALARKAIRAIEKALKIPPEDRLQ